MARYLNETGALFQHIPRTGGTFVEHALNELDISHSRWLKKQLPGMPMKHALLSQYAPMHRSNVKFVFAFVRHPVSYYCSMWRYLTDAARWRRRGLVIRGLCPGTRWRWHPMHVPARLYEPDFAAWVERMVEEQPMWLTRLVGLYVGPEDGEFCNFIGRTETLADDFVDVMTRLGYRTRGWAGRLAALGTPNTTQTPRLRVDEFTSNLICHSERLLIKRFYGERTFASRWYC